MLASSKMQQAKEKQHKGEERKKRVQILPPRSNLVERQARSCFYSLRLARDYTKESLTMAITLNSGFQRPIIGLGVWRMNGEDINGKDIKNLLLNAIKIGYRHFDCAAHYKNEAEVGEALAEAFSSGLVEDLFITTKAHPISSRFLPCVSGNIVYIKAHPIAAITPNKRNAPPMVMALYNDKNVIPMMPLMARFTATPKLQPCALSLKGNTSEL